MAINVKRTAQGYNRHADDGEFLAGPFATWRMAAHAVVPEPEAKPKKKRRARKKKPAATDEG